MSALGRRKVSPVAGSEKARPWASLVGMWHLEKRPPCCFLAGSWLCGSTCLVAVPRFHIAIDCMKARSFSGSAAVQTGSSPGSGSTWPNSIICRDASSLR
jgi:hypothetical protein